jgi:hypothetical protein
MRARRVGTGSEYRLFQDEQEIGWVDSTAVGFRGFATRDEAALAASAADHALGRSRAAAEKAERPLAALLPPAPEESTAGDWGFQIALLPNERMEVFALGRARVIWRALQGTGVSRRMRQFRLSAGAGGS